MDLVFIEEISLFEDVYEFKVYEYDSEINLNDKESFVCDLKIMINKVNENFISKVNQKLEAISLVKNLNNKYQSNKVKFEEIEKSLKEGIFQELEEIDLEKNDIEIVFTRS